MLILGLKGLTVGQALYLACELGGNIKKTSDNLKPAPGN